jgi:hypothetical protein
MTTVTQGRNPDFRFQLQVLVAARLSRRVKALLEVQIERPVASEYVTLLMAVSRASARINSLQEGQGMDIKNTAVGVAPDLLDMAWLLHEAGHEAGDFVIEKDPQSELGDLLGLGDGLVTVRHRRSGIERFYTTGGGADWRPAFQQDVLEGVFGAANEILEFRDVPTGWPTRR